MPGAYLRVALGVAVLAAAAGPQRLAAGYRAEVDVKGWSEVFDSQPWMKHRNKSPVVSDYHKLVVCSIPKCGSTTLRQLLWRMSTHQNSEGLTSAGRDEVHAWIKFHGRLLLDYSRKAILQILGDKSVAKIVIVRHPVERLLSAYRNKIENPKNNWGPKLGMGVNISFTRFVNVIASERRFSCEQPNGKRETNEHWDLMSCFCGLDTFVHAYKVYMLEDAPNMVRELVKGHFIPEHLTLSGYGYQSARSLFDYTVNDQLTVRGRTNEIVGQYYTKETLALVKRLYAKDFKVFNIDPHLYDDAVTKSKVAT